MGRQAGSSGMPESCFEIENAGDMKVSWKKAVSDTTYRMYHYLSIQWTTSHSDTDVTPSLGV